mmetsp:Transcript_9723/g.18900  ORF Transcript_9723/g.18900 Transcript_9723/m.18900 type:complete len:180 (+) Transcript_9723:315-854(+)
MFHSDFSEAGGEKVLRSIREFFLGHKFEPEDYKLYKGLKLKWFDLNKVEGEEVTIREFKTFCDKHRKHNTAESCKIVFDLIDTNHTGRITFEGFCAFNGLKLTKDMKKKLAECETRDPSPATRPASLTDGHGHLLHPPELPFVRGASMHSVPGTRKCQQKTSLTEVDFPSPLFAAGPAK